MKGDGYEESRDKAIMLLKGMIDGIKWVLNEHHGETPIVIENKDKKEFCQCADPGGCRTRLS